MSSSTRMEQSAIQSQLLNLLQDQPTEMVRRYLLYLSERLLLGRNNTAHKQIIHIVAESLTESKLPQATPPSIPILWLTDALNSMPLGKVVLSKDGSSASVSWHSVPME